MIYKKSIVWKKSMRLVCAIYEMVEKLPSEEKYGLASQMRRAAISIPSNIAEGAGRDSNGDFIRFLRISLGSVNELETQYQICIMLGLIKEDKNLLDSIDHIGRLISNLIKAIKSD